jgi:hypothetical protein
MRRVRTSSSSYFWIEGYNVKLRAGDWVEVRSKAEILKSLDRQGRLDRLPFMPHMFQYCGQQFQVYKRAHKTCDTVNQTGGRRLADAVHLDLRCDGETYGGCQAHCLIFWKGAWLKRVEREGRTDEGPQLDERVTPDRLSPTVGCTEEDVLAATQAEAQHPDGERRFVCQATELPHYTNLLPWWDVRQYMEDYHSGNVTHGALFRGFVFAGYQKLIKSGIGLGGPLRWLYDHFQALWGGIPYPCRGGRISAGQSTPNRVLNLQPGEVVRVKSYQEILSTLDVESKNRGLYFDTELVPYCGGIYQVKTRVSKYINEKTGMMVNLKTDAVILEGVWCQARYSNCRMFCPRSIYSWWREIWLERIPGGNHDADVPRLRSAFHKPGRSQRRNG